MRPTSSAASKPSRRVITNEPMKLSFRGRAVRWPELGLPNSYHSPADRVELEAHVVALRRGEGREVVGAERRRRRLGERLAIDPMATPHRPAALEGTRPRRGQHPVA